MQIIAGVAIIKNKKVLLVQQTDDGDQPGKWGPPAGHANDNETLIETAIRETKEETGLDIKILGVVQAGFFEYKEKTYVFVFYHAAPSGSIKIKPQQEVQASVWATLKDIKVDKYPLRKKFLKESLILSLTQKSSPINVFVAVKIEK